MNESISDEDTLFVQETISKRKGVKDISSSSEGKGD